MTSDFPASVAVADAVRPQPDSRHRTLLLSCVLSCVLVAACCWNSAQEENQPFFRLQADRRFVALTAEIPVESDESSSSLLFSSGKRALSVTASGHKELWPLDVSDVMGFLLAMLGLIIAAGGGIGGGGILVPIYILVWNFSPKFAVPLSNITVFGGAVANTIINVGKRHPKADRPLIDWNLVLIMEPLAIAGALIGAFINKLLPDLLLSILLVVLLSIMGTQTMQKARSLHRKESAVLRSDSTASSETAALTNSGTGYGATKNQETPAAVNTESSAELEEILQAERTVPTFSILVLVALFVVVLTVNLAKGGGAFVSPLGITCGSSRFWLANLFILIVIVAVSLYARHLLVAEYYRKEHVGYQYVEGDIRWNERNSVIYPLLCTTAGIFSGMFGVGGGIIQGPLMLAMGILPSVSSANVACMILFTSFTATTSFVVFGLLILDYGLICLFVGFFSTFAGRMAMDFLMSRSNRASYIAFSIGGVVVLSALLMTMQAIISVVNGTGTLCSSRGICRAGA
jgi:uncharacterized membrane protein YfcA